MEAQEQQSGLLETYAIVEVMGHSKFAGKVRQVAMGGAAMIRVDVSEIPEREEEWQTYEYTPEGTKPVTKKRTIAATPAFTKFLGIGSIFAITPCSEEVAMEAVKQFRSAPITVLQMPERRGLPAPAEDLYEDERDLDL